jgi:diacylglycerol kinase family enzyme
MPTPVIINASAGTGWDDAHFEELAQAFRDAGMEVEILAARSGDEIRSHAKAALARNPGTLVAGGGDGTISSVASLVRGTSTVLGILPLGTLNHFAKDLGIPMALREAIALLARGNVAEVDVGVVNGRMFLNNSSLGIYPDIVRDRTRQQRRLGRGKRWALLWATWTALRRSAFLHLRITVDGRERIARTPFIFIGNNAYIMEGFEIGQRDGLSDGKLSVYFTRRCTRLGLVALGFRALFGQLKQAKDFEAALAEEVTVETHHPRLPVSADGEVFASQSPFAYRIHPRALKVVAP